MDPEEEKRQYEQAIYLAIIFVAICVVLALIFRYFSRRKARNSYYNKAL